MKYFNHKDHLKCILKGLKGNLTWYRSKHIIFLLKRWQKSWLWRNELRQCKAKLYLLISSVKMHFWFMSQMWHLSQKIEGKVVINWDIINEKLAVSIISSLFFKQCFKLYFIIEFINISLQTIYFTVKSLDF